MNFLYTKTVVLSGSLTLSEDNVIGKKFHDNLLQHALRIRGAITEKRSSHTHTLRL